MAAPIPGAIDGYELFRWLTLLKQRVEEIDPGMVTISASQVTSGVFDPARIPQLPYTRIDLTISPRLLGRTSAGAGPAEQILVAGGLQLANGILSLAGLPTGFVIGDLLYADTDHSLARLADVALGSYLRSGGVATPPLWSTLKLPNAATSGNILKASGADVYASVAPQALTKTDDTNVTLTLGGSPATALVNAASITVGWTGVLSLLRGGLGFNASGIAKGGLFTGTGAGTVGITTVAADGTVLTADAASAGGVKWEAGSVDTYAAPLTNGSPETPEVVFDSFGDIVMVTGLTA